MVFRGIAAGQSVGVIRLLPLVMGTCLIVGCVEEPRPRSYLEFMEDPIAREGTLARCNQDRNATSEDPECINARRAASTAAARVEAARAEQLEAASDIKREAFRERVAAQQAAARRAEEAAQRAEEAAYDAQWTENQAPSPPRTEFDASASVPSPEAQPGDPAHGPSGNVSNWEQRSPVLPATGADQLSFIEVPAVESPVNKVLGEIELPAIATPRQPEPEPEPKLEELTIPRPFRHAEPQ